MWSVIVHGGAGAVKDALANKHKAGCIRAVEAATKLLSENANAVDAACAAIRILEDDPTYNASTGGALDRRGLVTVDAAIMRGSDLGYGAIGAVAGVARAIDLARAIMEDGAHALLCGPSALAFARKANIPLVDPDQMRTDARKRDLEKRLLELAKANPDHAADWSPSEHGTEDGAEAQGTVGAVVRDAIGLIVAVTSTGGLTAKYPGRVGDSPIAGAGTYARNDLGGASATGHGETMMKTVFTYQLLLALRGIAPARASEIIRAELDQATARAGGKGGAIAVLPDGTIAFARNTAHMGVAWASSTGQEGADF